MDRSTLRTAAAYALLVAVGALLLAPFAWLLSTALKAESADLFAYPPQWIPNPVVWGNFTKAWEILPFELYIFNTFCCSWSYTRPYFLWI